MKISKIIFIFLLFNFFLLLNEQAVIAASSTDIFVDTFEDELNDDEYCSLREAIHSANGNPIAACVDSDPGPGAHIFLQIGVYYLGIPGRDDDLNLTGDLDLRRSMNIHGISQEETIIHGGNIDRVFELVIYDINVLIAGVTIRNGDVTVGEEGGGGILVGYGAKLFLNNSRVTNNNTPNSLGGGIDNYAGQVTITNCTIDNNIAKEGGGIYNDGHLEIYQSLINENNANLHGGGLKNSEPNAEAILENVTISRNNCNVGSGIYSNDIINLKNVTVVRNSGLGAGFVNLGLANLTNTIIALHYGQNNCTGDAADFNSAGYNLEDNLSDGNSCHLYSVGDLVDVDPMLVGDAPQDNGGITFTYSLQDSSPAIDAGNPTDFPATDQRGYPRPVDGDDDGVAVCDIGAYEAPMRMYFPIIFR